jgi:glutamate-1-semialdehyde 2,1-aminomutase/spore coat polysaccharide biosynthesis protein SpsF
LTTLVILQARMGSKRLPGKVLLPIRGRKTVIAEIVERSRAIAGIDGVICAIPDTIDCEELAGAAQAAGAIVFRGSEKDVLDRYHQAARRHAADTIIRITGDCPLIDPYLCGDLIHFFRLSGADLAANDILHTWPVGLGCEVFTFASLERAAAEAKAPEEREHVSPFMLNHPDMRVVGLVNLDGDYGHYRWTLDTMRDYEMIRELFGRLPEGPAAYDYRVPLSIVQADPPLAKWNRIA